ncbi:MAG: flagellar protein FlaG [Planctomycetes bacterium]|nr:flagellar protein FlaG [Planctomycetota bacterium]
MAGPIDPGSFNFLGLTPPNSIAAPGQDSLAQGEVRAPIPVGGSTGDMVEISREAQDAARAVNPNAATQGAPGENPPTGRGGAETIDRQGTAGPQAREGVLAQDQAAAAARPEQAARGLASQAAASQVSNYLNTAVRFSLNRNLGSIQAQVVDRRTGETVRSIPPDERMRIAEQFARNAKDLFQEEEGGALDAIA